jgi:hypothetical protein
MASAVNAVCCAALAAAFWGLLGHAIARHLLPRALSLGAAPVIGWAVFSAATLPIFILIGFSPIIVVGTGAVCAAIGGGSLCDAAGLEWGFACAGGGSMGLHRRRDSCAGAGRRDPAEIFRGWRASRRSDLRSFQRSRSSMR